MQQYIISNTAVKDFASSCTAAKIISLTEHHVRFTDENENMPFKPGFKISGISGVMQWRTGVAEK